MTISKDLFLAILSLDSYNRGYHSGISDSGDADPDEITVTVTDLIDITARLEYRI